MKSGKIVTGMILPLLLLISNINAQETVAAADTSKRIFTIDECINEFSMKDTVGTGVGYQYWFFGKNFLDGRTVKMSVVGPHQATHAPHMHKEDEFMYVLEGTAELILNGKSRIVGPNSCFYCPPNTVHGFKNAGDTELKYLIFKKYIMEK